MNYDMMEAGREMDALVAEKVMGLPKVSSLNKDSRCPITGGEMRMGIDRAWCFDCSTWHYGPHKEYSADISAAWEVVEKMQWKGFIWSMNYRNPAMSDLKYMPYVGFWHYTDGKLDKQGYSDALELPLAVCRAALKAAGKG